MLILKQFNKFDGLLDGILDGQLKNIDSINTDGIQSMFVITILEKIKETRL